MSHSMKPEDFWGLDNSPEQVLADENLRAQEHLWETLLQALKESGRSVDDVASRLGIPADLVESISKGRVDVSLSDLREYAYAVDAFISYRVTSRYTSNLETYRRSLAEVPQHWHGTTAAHREDDSPAESALRALKLTHG